MVGWWVSVLDGLLQHRHDAVDGEVGWVCWMGGWGWGAVMAALTATMRLMKHAPSAVLTAAP